MIERRRFTEPQLKALMSLPSDGSWTTKLGGLSPAVNSLALYHKGLAEIEFGNFGPRGGWMSRYRLTEEGVKEQAARR